MKRISQEQFEDLQRRVDSGRTTSEDVDLVNAIIDQVKADHASLEAIND